MLHLLLHSLDDTDLLLFLLVLVLLLVETHFVIKVKTCPNVLCSLRCCASARSTRLIWIWYRSTWSIVMTILLLSNCEMYLGWRQYIFRIRTWHSCPDDNITKSGMFAQYVVVIWSHLKARYDIKVIKFLVNTIDIYNPTQPWVHTLMCKHSQKKMLW